MIERIVNWAAWQKLSIDECKRMCDTWSTDPAYWAGRDLWRLYDVSNPKI